MNHLIQKKPANINNTNNNNNTNDTNNKLTTLQFTRSDQSSDLTSSMPLGRESQEEGSLDPKGKRKSVKLPAEWRGVKLDLFCNGSNKDGSPKLKLNVGVIRHIDGESIPLQASLNMSWDDGVRRGVDKQQWSSNSHWIKCKQHRKELNYLVDDLRSSKIGKKSKHGGTEWVAFVYCVDTTWMVDIVREGNVLHFELTDKLSTAQIKQGNMIATGYFGLRQTALIDPKKEWGI